MSFIPELRNWFFRTNAPLNSEGKKINLENGSRPDQDLFERLSQSIPFKKEADDRAKISTGGALENEVGIVSIAPDTDVTNAGTYVGTSGLSVDRTKVVHAGQLSTVAQDVTSSFDGVTGDAQAPSATNITTVSVTVDPTTTTRNNFLVRMSSAFVTWMNGIVGNITNINTYVYGTGGQDSPADNGTGLGGVIYGPGGTQASPTSPGLVTTIYGPNGDPNAPSGPSVLETLYGPGGTPDSPGTGGLIDSTTEGTLQVKDNDTLVPLSGTTTKVLNFYSSTTTDVVVTDSIPASNEKKVDFSNLSGRVTTNASNISTNSGNISTLQTNVNNLLNGSNLTITDTEGNDTVNPVTIVKFEASEYRVIDTGSGIATVYKQDAYSSPALSATLVSGSASTLSNTTYTFVRTSRNSGFVFGQTTITVPELSSCKLKINLPAGIVTNGNPFVIGVNSGTSNPFKFSIVSGGFESDETFNGGAGGLGSLNWTVFFNSPITIQVL